MSAITAELESELVHELAHEGAHEAHPEAAHEAHEHEAAAEQEAFFNHLAAMADRSGRSQALRRVALAAARQVMRAQSSAPVIEGEAELSHEFELESHTELGPEGRARAIASMEHMAHRAAAAESELEAAEHFLPLIPLAAKVVAPVAARVLPTIGRRVLPGLIRRIAPQLTRGVAQVTRTLFRSPAARPLIRTVPTIVRRTVATLARQYAGGRPITGPVALRTLASQTARTLAEPRRAVHAFRRSRYWDQRYHLAARRVVGPAGPARVITPARLPQVAPAIGATVATAASRVWSPPPATVATQYAAGIPVPVVALMPYGWAGSQPAVR